MTLVTHAAFAFYITPIQLKALENPQPVRADSKNPGPPAVERYTAPAQTLDLQREIFNQPSPVERFRALLTAEPIERDLLLAEFEAGARSKIQNKIQEYENLSSELRFNRLMATELRWYLPAILKFESAERQQLVEKLDPKLAQLILIRAAIWDQLPVQAKNSPDQKTLIIQHLCKATSSAPPLPKEKSPQGTNGTPTPSQPPAPSTPPQLPGTGALGALSLQENQRIQRLQSYFGLSPEKKKEMLKSVESASDSSFINRLKWLEDMPEGIRSHALRQLVRLKELSPRERQSLGETLGTWNRLSEEQKSSLRQLLDKQPPSPGALSLSAENQ